MVILVVELAQINSPEVIYVRRKHKKWFFYTPKGYDLAETENILTDAYRAHKITLYEGNNFVIDRFVRGTAEHYRILSPTSSPVEGTEVNLKQLSSFLF